MFRRKVVDNLIEERILAGLITNTSYCKNVSRLLKKDIFIIPYSSIVLKWCLDYFKTYNEAPGKHILDIFEMESISGNLKAEDRDLIGAFVDKLLANYEKESETNFAFLEDKTIAYVKKRSLKNTADKMNRLLENDKVDDAESELEKYKQTSKATSTAFDPLCDEVVKKFFDNVNNKANEIFSMPGKLGEHIGMLERYWLVGILAPSKRGKTFWQQEFAVQAIMAKKKVLFVSLEMNEKGILKRLYKRLTGFADRSGDFIYPCFDCLKNQNNSCDSSNRTCKVKLLIDEKTKPKYNRISSYVPCTFCRDNKKYAKDYVVATWLTTIKREKIKASSTIKVVSGIKQAFGDRIRVQSYPKFSANIKDIMAALNDLDVKENFQPDVIIIDYADILAPEDSRLSTRERVDETWKMMGRMAGENHCLVISASQSNRKSFNKKYVEEVDIAEDIRKIANSDLFIALNQTKEEKKEGVMRINIIANRDADFDSQKSCLVLQQLSVGQVCLDSEIIARKDDETDYLSDNFD